MKSQFNFGIDQVRLVAEAEKITVEPRYCHGLAHEKCVTVLKKSKIRREENPRTRIAISCMRCGGGTDLNGP
jgi:hypothetical protein